MIYQPPRKSQQGSVVVIFLFLVALIATCTAGYFYWQHQQDVANEAKLTAELTQLNQMVNASPVVTPTVVATPTVIVVDNSASPKPQQVGYIQGKVSYPSEVLPKQRICAVNTTTSIESCTEEYQGNAYKLGLPPATYHVYAMVLPGSDAQLKTKAYYTEFVTCGLQANCPSHKQLDVVVKAGETTSNVDPGDWYNQ